MIATADRKTQRVRCAIYTRKSNDEGMDQDFNSLDAQREAAEAFIASQRHEGWRVLRSMKAMARSMADGNGRRMSS